MAIRAWTVRLAVVALLALVATSSSRPQPAFAGSVTVTGTGSTWDQIATNQWAADAHTLFGITINYQGVGSTAGRSFYIENQVDFGDSDIPFLPDELAQIHSEHKTFQYLPTVAGGTGITYVLPVLLRMITEAPCPNRKAELVWAIRKDDHRGFVRNFAVTLVLGILFLGMQLYDYTVLYSEELTLDAGPFGTTYYTLTGFHGAHVFGGALMLAVVVYRGMAGQFSSRHHDMVEATSLYWHFVDVVWILLFSILYLL